MSDLRGAGVLVTGASGGLGAALVQRLAAAGAHLILSARDTERLAGQAPVGAVVVAADLRLPDAPATVIETAVERLGRLDGLVHAAGVVAFGPVADADDDLLDEVFLTNLLGPMRLLRHALPHLRAAAADRPGAFAAMISAVVAEQPMAGMAAYSASKAALTAFDAALAKEVRRDRVRVLDIRPPHTETGLVNRAIAGTAPKLPTGLDPGVVADRIIAAIQADERDLPAAAFS